MSAAHKFHFGRAVLDDPTFVQIGDANTDCIAVTNESQPLVFCPPRNKLALKDHVAGLHVDLVEMPEWARPILDHVGYCVERRAKIYVPFVSHDKQSYSNCVLKVGIL